MNSNKPYLLRALNDWILDNGLTPHLIVDAYAEGVEVPGQAIKDGKLVLNIAAQATAGLQMGNDSISFQARFSGVSFDIFLPIEAIMAIYARENGQGMMFARDKDQAKEKQAVQSPITGPHLKLIK